MKFTPEVVAALAVLRVNAESDFERHRIDVLGRDLTAPPVAEIIDDTHQKFLGFIYRAEPKGHFVRNQFIHRDVWQYFNGDIPEGDYEIHHIDHNKANNDISNLQLLTRTEHGKIHTAHARHFRDIYCSKACSDKAKIKPLLEKTCPICGKTFLVKSYESKKQCCSVSCSCKLRRQKSEIKKEKST